MSALRPGTPQEAGLDAHRLARLHDRALEWVDAGVTNSLVLLVARNGTVAHLEAYGRDGPEPDAAPLRTDAIFPLCSQGKPYVAAMIMKLVEEGAVSLTRPVQTYLPEFVGVHKDEVLVHHLLTHTSGLSADDSAFWSRWFRLHDRLDVIPCDPTDHPWVSSMVSLATALPLVRPVGSLMAYSSNNFLLLGEIVRRTTGESLDDAARRMLFDPLGMASSSFGIPEAMWERLPRRRPSVFSVPGPFDTPEGRQPPGGMGGWGAAHSTAEDIAVFHQMALDGGTQDDTRILHSSTIDRMTTNQIPGVAAEIATADQSFRVREAGAGLGWLIKNEEIWPNAGTIPDGAFCHGGGGIHFAWADPATGVIGVYCSVADLDGQASPGDGFHRGDRFVQMVTASVLD